VTTEVEERRPRWPVWYGPAAFVSGLLATLIVYSVVHAVAVGVGGDVSSDSPGFQLAGTLIQDALLVGAAILFASFVAPPRPWQFGLRGAPLKSTAQMAGLAMLAFYAFVAVYYLAFHPHGSQSVAKDLGADKGGIDMVLGAVLVVGVAPFAEEFFFRGFFYRALRSRCSVIVAAGIDGVVFGGIHYTDPKVLPLLPILAVLGFLFCLLYEYTGTLFAPIALHSINNGIAYAGTVDGSTAISVGLAAGVVAGCVLTLRALPRRLTPV
jgi:membrane protease YdiL (CAAX protease family)